MNIVFMGTPDFALPSLKRLLDEGHNVQAVFTQTDKPKGRGNKLVFTPVKEFAITQNIPVYQPNSLKKETEIYTPIIKNYAPDAIVVVAYGKLLPLEVLNIPRFGCINVHGSLLPKYRGAAPIQWTVLNGDEYGGITTMLMAQGMDTGDMLLQEAIKVGENETAAEYYERLSYVGAELLIKTLVEVEKGRIVPEKQNESEATLAPMLNKEMSPIDFRKPAKKVYDHIMGLSDWPCAACFIDGKKLKVYRCEIVSQGETNCIPGEIVKAEDFTIACGEGSIRFTEVQLEGAKRMQAKDYLRGHPIKKGIILS